MARSPYTWRWQSGSLEKPPEASVHLESAGQKVRFTWNAQPGRRGSLANGDPER